GVAAPDGQGPAPRPRSSPRRRQGLPVALFLHPRDCRLVSLELPALPAAKLAAAVNCAAEALVLGDPAQLRLAHGPRGAY
ncbi:type II secretion system protein GspL, partial [Pseudomonas aeruginosa]